jgi:hypothetical protein
MQNFAPGAFSVEQLGQIKAAEEYAQFGHLRSVAEG